MTQRDDLTVWRADIISKNGIYPPCRRNQKPTFASTRYATCPTGHPATHTGCRCGIYGCTTPEPCVSFAGLATTMNRPFPNTKQTIRMAPIITRGTLYNAQPTPSTWAESWRGSRYTMHDAWTTDRQLAELLEARNTDIDVHHINRWSEIP